MQKNMNRIILRVTLAIMVYSLNIYHLAYPWCIQGPVPCKITISTWKVRIL